jgi:TetR/AcrR family transcriptional regulator, repressor for uid operon
MSLSSLSPSRRAPDAERRERIIEAAERAFVRNGFHASTMQHVADEAGMSPGNLYRYFPSKEAIVEGLCEVDRGRRAGSFDAFADLMARNGDLTDAIRWGMREHVLSKPPEKARMIVEIWAEAGRNPRVAEITQRLDADVLSGLERLPELNSRFAARFFVTYVAGLFKRIAVEPDFDRDAETDMAIGVLKALFAGKLSPDPAEPGEEA